MAKKKVTKKKTTRRKRGEPAPDEVWASLKDQVDLESAESYSMRGSFSVNTAIQHPKFGLGVITSVLSNKIEVVFEEGPKSLVHNRT